MGQHPAKKQSQRSDLLQPLSLPCPQQGRTVLQPDQAMPPGRDTLRQTRRQLPCLRPACIDPALAGRALMSPRPRWMHQLKTAYTVYFNRRHQLVGHLFQGRFKSMVIEAERYLLEVSRYLNLNPRSSQTHVSTKILKSLSFFFGMSEPQKY
jgi:hypothetical protein